MSIDQRLRQLSIELPTPVQPLGSYCTAVQVGGLLFLSGHVPLRDGTMEYVGKLGREVTIEQGQAAARFTALNCLATVRAALGSLDRVRRVVRLTGYVNSAAGFKKRVTQSVVLRWTDKEG